VPAALLLWRHGLRFIGVIKTATKQYPYKCLHNKVLRERGDRYGLVQKKNNNEECDVLAFVWVDQGRRYFIATGSSLGAGTPMQRRRYRQMNQEDPNADAELVHLTIAQPQACEVYYNACGMIDRHNRCRQDDLDLEKKIQTRFWARRFNMSLFGMCVVDAWLAYKQVTKTKEDQIEFYIKLSEELIDNRYDRRGRGRTENGEPDSPINSVLATDGTTRCGVGIHCTPTKKMRARMNGDLTKARLQGNCKICSKKSSRGCSDCKDKSVSGIDCWICLPKTKRNCFRTHLEEKHS
jgi:hypothetical protein